MSDHRVYAIVSLPAQSFEDGVVMVMTATCTPEYATLHGVCKVTEKVRDCVPAARHVDPHHMLCAGRIQ